MIFHQKILLPELVILALNYLLLKAKDDLLKSFIFSFQVTSTILCLNLIACSKQQINISEVLISIWQLFLKPVHLESRL